MEKYSKSRLVAKRYMIVIIAIFIVILAVFGYYLFKILTTDKIVYELIDRKASSVNDDEATNSTPIIINNIVIGGVYNSKWVDSLKYMQLSKYKEGTEIDVFNNRGKSGTYKIDKIESRKNKYDIVYADIIKNDYVSEYYAISKGASGVNLASKIDITENNKNGYEKMAKKALYKYNYINTTIKINEAYLVSVNFEKKYTLLFVTNDGNVDRGVYSAIIAIPNDKSPFCIKYNYYKDVKNAGEFGVYSFKFTGDLNSDGNSEIIVQNTKEFSTKYSVLELIDDKFYEILSSTIVTN